MIRLPLLLSVIIMTGMIGVSYYGWTEIPAGTEIATHWDMDGNVNGTSSRNTILFGLPIIAVIITALFAFIPSIDPRAEHAKANANLLAVGWIGALVTLLFSHLMIVIAAVNRSDTSPISSNAALLFVCAVFVVAGNVTAKSRSNFFLGIRTPWTLSSEHSWNVTNRLCGWLFVLTGLGAAAATLISGEALGAKLLFAGVATIIVAGFAVSYFAWRGDPERKQS